MSTRRHWYHCTTLNHGDRFIAKRRPPILRTSKEPVTPRICVAPTVAACFAAVAFSQHKPVYVYRTEKEQRGVKPSGVWDQFLTRERWLIPPVPLVMHEVIPEGKVLDAQGLIVEYHHYTKKNSDILLRFAQFAIAVDVLGGTAYEKRVVSKLMKKWGWSDPRNYVIGKYVDWANAIG